MTRLEWKMRKLQRKIPIDTTIIVWALCILTLIIILIITVPIAYDKINKTITDFQQKQQKQIMQEQLLAEKQKQKQKQKQKEEQEEKLKIEHDEKDRQKKQQREMDIRKYYFKKGYKVGDRIKIMDLNRVIQEGDSYRLSIGDIDVIAKIDYDNLTMECESGKVYHYGIEIQKVQSKREWRDLVYMKLNNQLNFYEVRENE